MDKTQPQKLLEEIIPHDEDEKYPSDPEPLIIGRNEFPTVEEQSDPEPLIIEEYGFPTIEEQKKYWVDKEKAAEPKPPRKWSAARRRRYNAKKAKEVKPPLVKHPMFDYPPKEGQIAPWDKLPPPPQQPVPVISHCPFCGESIQRFLS